MKKLILIILVIAKIGFLPLLAYNSDDWFNIYYQGNPTWQDIYVVPEGKDLVINFLYSDSLINAELFFRDNGIDIGGGGFNENKNSVFLVVKDLLQLKDTNSNNNFTITGILIDEGDDISAIINGESEKLDHFTKEQIANLLQFEVVAVYILGVWVFFKRIR